MNRAKKSLKFENINLRMNAYKSLWNHETARDQQKIDVVKPKQ